MNKDEKKMVAGMVNLINEAHEAMTEDGAFAKDTVAACKRWFEEHHVPVQFVANQYVLGSPVNNQEQHEP